MQLQPMKLKILASHPVQYHVPYFRQLAKNDIDILIGYYHQGTAGRKARDEEFNLDIEWDLDLLSGYAHQIFLPHLASYRLSEQIKIAPRLISFCLRDRRTPLLIVGWTMHVFWLVWMLRLLVGAPTIVISENNPLSFALTPKPRWRVGLLSWLLRHSAACLAIGQRSREFYQGMGVPEVRIFHVPYSIDNERFRAAFDAQIENRTALCQRYGLDPQLPTFLFSGKLIEKKRPLLLLDAFIESGLDGQAQLVFVGEGKLRSAVEARIHAAGLEHVHLIGFLNQTEMPIAYVLGECLCLLSDAGETWGLVVNESLACGRPVIVADTVGSSPDLVDPSNGWVVPLDDQAALVAALRSALEHRGEWETMGKHGADKISAHTFQAMAQGTMTALAAVDRR